MRSFIKGFQHSNFVKQGSFEQYMAKKKKATKQADSTDEQVGSGQS